MSTQLVQWTGESAKQYSQRKIKITKFKTEEDEKMIKIIKVQGAEHK